MGLTLVTKHDDDPEKPKITKRQALLELRLMREFRICPQKDYQLLIKHLGANADYTHVQVKNIKIHGVKHMGFVFLPCDDEDMTNCFYDRRKAWEAAKPKRDTKLEFTDITKL